MRDETVMNELPETGSLRLCTDFRDCVENVKKLFYASLFTHGLFTWFNDFTTTVRLTPTQNFRLIRKKHTRGSVP